MIKKDYQDFFNRGNPENPINRGSEFSLSICFFNMKKILDKKIKVYIFYRSHNTTTKI